jgi:predicted solute-binding protein
LKDLEAFAFRGIPELCDGKIKGMMTPSLDPVSNQTNRQQMKQLSVSSAGGTVAVL